MEDQEPTYVELYLPTCSMDPMLRRLDIPTPTYQVGDRKIRAPHPPQPPRLLPL